MIIQNLTHGLNQGTHYSNPKASHLRCLLTLNAIPSISFVIGDYKSIFLLQIYNITNVK
jgi:hypothetical protein